MRTFWKDKARLKISAIELLRNNSLLCKNILDIYCVPAIKESLAVQR